MSMRNFSLTDSDEENPTSDEFKEEFRKESEQIFDNSGNIENNGQNIEQSATTNKKRRNINRKSVQPKKKLKKVNSNTSRKQKLKRKSSASNNIERITPEKMNNEEDNLDISKRKRKRKNLPRHETTIERELTNKPSAFQIVETTKKTIRSKSVQTRSQYPKNKSKIAVAQCNNDQDNIKRRKFSENSFSDHPEKNIPSSISKNNQRIINKKPKPYLQHNEMSEEENYQYESQSDSNQFEIDIMFENDQNESQNKNTAVNKNQIEEVSNESSPILERSAIPQNTQKIKNKNTLLSNPDIAQKNNGFHFQPKIEEFYYDSYSQPPKLRIDTTLVAQSNNLPSLKISDPYRVTNFSSKMNDSESDIGKQNNKSALRDLIIVSGSEYDYSSQKMNYPDHNISRRKKNSKTDNFVNDFDQETNSDYSEIKIKKKSSNQKSNDKLNRNNLQISAQSQYSSTSDIPNDGNTNNNTSKNTSFNKDKEFVININISDKFNATRNDNNIDIETPKQVNNSHPFDSRRLSNDEKNLLELKDSRNLNPLQNLKSINKITKKLNISPAINVQKDGFSLNIVNESPYISDAVIYRIEDDEKTLKPSLHIQPTNSFDQSSSSNNINARNTSPEIYNLYNNDLNTYSTNLNQPNYYKNSLNAFDNNNNKNRERVSAPTFRENEIVRKSQNNGNNHIVFSCIKDKKADFNNQLPRNHTNYDDSRNRKRGDSVPRHKFSFEEQEKNPEIKNAVYSDSRERNVPSYEIHHQDPTNNFEGNIVFRDGRYVRRVKVRKSQRSSSVVPNKPLNNIPNSNVYYHSRDIQPIQNDQHYSNPNHNYQNRNYQPYSNPNLKFNDHNHINDHYSNSNYSPQNWDYEQHPGINHYDRHHNQGNNVFSNGFENNFSNSNHHHFSHNENLNPNNNINNDNYFNHNDNENNRNYSRSTRSSSASRVRVKKKVYYSNHSNPNQNDHHQNRRSASAPKKNSMPCYLEDYNNQPNNHRNHKKDYNSDIEMDIIASSEGNRNERKKSYRSSHHSSESKKTSQEITPFLLRKEKETQTQKEKQGNKNLNADAFCISSCEIDESRSVFLDLSQIEKNDEKSTKKASHFSDGSRHNLSSESEINSKIDRSLEKRKDSSSSRSQHHKSIYKQLSELSEKSLSESKNKKKRRTHSRASSRSSISISMATPSPSASGIATSEFEIVQTPLKDLVKNRNTNISDISSEFKEEEADNDDSYVRLGEKIKKIGTNLQMPNDPPAKKVIKEKRRETNKIKIKKNSAHFNNSVKNYNKTNYIKMNKNYINQMFNVLSSDDDENTDNFNMNEDSGIIVQLAPEPSSFNTESQNYVPYNKYKKIKRDKSENSLSNNNSAMSTSITPSNTDYSSSIYSSNLVTRKI